MINKYSCNLFHLKNSDTVVNVILNESFSCAMIGHSNSTCRNVCTLFPHIQILNSLGILGDENRPASINRLCDSFRNYAVLVPNRPRSTSNGVKCISNLASKIWDLI